MVKIVTLNERKLWKKLKNESKRISWTRLENWALFGTPDLLGYAPSGNFFTVELKVIKGNRIRFSPHQISFHITHSKNTFILIRTLGPRSLKLFQGSAMRELVALGYACDLPVACDWPAVRGALLDA